MKTSQPTISKERIQEILEFLKSLRLPVAKTPLKTLILQLIVRILIYLINREKKFPTNQEEKSTP